jgi:hypothetical protein
VGGQLGVDLCHCYFSDVEGQIGLTLGLGLAPSHEIDYRFSELVLIHFECDVQEDLRLQVDDLCWVLLSVEFLLEGAVDERSQCFVERVSYTLDDCLSEEE